MSTLTPARPAHRVDRGSPESAPRRPAARRTWPAPIAIAVGLMVVAAALRLIGIADSYNLFIDEATYAAIARDSSLATGPLLHGLPFLLHPPLALMALSASAHVLGTQDVAALVEGLRPAVALVGSLTVGVIYLALRSAGLRWSALAAAALIALDPLIISFDSRVMLEAFAQLFAALTIAAAIRSATADPRVRWRWSVLTAIFGAGTFGSKETFGVVILAALIVVAITARRGSRAWPWRAVAGTLLGYAAVNVVMISWGGLLPWWQMRTQGLARLLGTQQSTGFKSEGVQTSFWERILPNGAELGATYAVLAVGGICALLLLVQVLRRRAQMGDHPPAAIEASRIVAIWAVSACAYVAYAVVFGSLEEQMFYIAAGPCAAALAIGAVLPRRRSLRIIAATGLALILVSQGAAWVLVHTTRDDTYDQFLSEISAAVPAGSTIAVTEETAQFVLTGYDLGQWTTESELVANEVEYVLLSDRLVTHGYGLADGDFATEVKENGSLVLSIDGRESDLQLYDVTGWTGAGETS